MLIPMFAAFAFTLRCRASGTRMFTRTILSDSVVGLLVFALIKSIITLISNLSIIIFGLFDGFNPPHSSHFSDRNGSICAVQR